MDIELIETKHSDLTAIRRRLIVNDIKNVNPDFTKLEKVLMLGDRENFYTNRQMLIDIMERVVEVAFMEGQQTGRVVKEYIGGDNGFKKDEVYKKRSDNYVGD